MGLEDLKLLYNNILDVWVALCEEKGWDWGDADAYQRFILYLQRNGVTINRLPVCSNESGKRALLQKRSFKLLGDPNKTYVIRTDGRVLELLRRFDQSEGQR